MRATRVIVRRTWNNALMEQCHTGGTYGRNRRLRVQSSILCNCHREPSPIPAITVCYHPLLPDTFSPIIIPFISISLHPAALRLNDKHRHDLIRGLLEKPLSPNSIIRRKCSTNCSSTSIYRWRAVHEFAKEIVSIPTVNAFI